MLHMQNSIHAALAYISYLLYRLTLSRFFHELLSILSPLCFPTALRSAKRNMGSALNEAAQQRCTLAKRHCAYIAALAAQRYVTALATRFQGNDIRIRNLILARASVEQSLIDSLRQGGICAMFHVGDHWRSVCAIAARLPGNIEVGILKIAELSQSENRSFDVLRRIRSYSFFSAESRKDIVRLSRFVKKGGILFIFCDVPPIHGSFVATNLFDRRSYFIDGCARLAMMFDSTISVCEARFGPDFLDIDLALRAVLQAPGRSPADNQTKDASLRGITQKLASYFEAQVCLDPSRWHYWRDYELFVHHLPPNVSVLRRQYIEFTKQTQADEAQSA